MSTMSGGRRSKGILVVLVALGAGLLLVSTFVGYSAAHIVHRDTSLSIDKLPSKATDSGDRVLLIGELGPKRCEDRQTIQLKKKRPGVDRVLDTDKTDTDGEYRFRLNPDQDMTVYTRFAGSVDSSYGYGHSHTCKKSVSARVLVKVTG